mgnify:CR=1 FL=1
MIKYKVITPPSQEPVTLAEAKNWLKVEHSEDDSLISALIQATREAVERYTGQSLFTAVIEQAYDGFPVSDIHNPFAGFTLAWSPVQSVDSITYRLETGGEEMLAADRYTLDNYAKPSQVMPKYNSFWPSAYYHVNSVKIRYTVGRSDVADIPEVFKTAIKMTLADYYDKRQDSVRNLPSQAEWLLDKYRVKWF